MLDPGLTIPLWLEMAATLTGGISGAMSGVRARYDLFGVISLAIATGLSGGIIRDICLQDYGIYAFQNPSLLVVCALAGVLVFYFGKLIAYLDPVVDLLDNLSVGLWGVISVGKCMSAGMDVISAIVVGTIAAVGGGIIRDLFMNYEPEVFQAGPLFGVAALAGCTMYGVLLHYNILTEAAGGLSVILVLFLRYASLIFHWRTKPPHDFTDAVTHAVARPVRTVVRHISPPKGKVERERERRGYERWRAYWRRAGEKAENMVSENRHTAHEAYEAAITAQRQAEDARRAAIEAAAEAAEKAKAEAEAAAIAVARSEAEATATAIAEKQSMRTRWENPPDVYESPHDDTFSVDDLDISPDDTAGIPTIMTPDGDADFTNTTNEEEKPAEPSDRIVLSHDEFKKLRETTDSFKRIR
ncbi:MAG: trimeric intracellular cation channel family protein [Eggerthellaceae bacterium]|jgi:uncharacterized membrane protein YeiH